VSSINVNPSSGFVAEFLDPDNPLYPSATLNGAYFNGTTFLESFGDEPIVLNSYTHTISFWYKIGIGAPVSQFETLPIVTNEDAICYRTGLQIYMDYNSTQNVSNLNVSAFGANIANNAYFSLEVPTHDDTWHHIAIYQKSWENGESIEIVYLDGVQEIFTEGTDFISDGEFAYYDYWSVAAGQRIDPQRFVGCIDELYITFDDLDLSINNNIDKFINPVTLKPVILGINGNIPTGNPAYIYLNGTGTNFSINYGSRVEPFIIQGDIQSCTSKFPDGEVDPIIGYNSILGTVQIIGIIPTYSKT
jgi:hypothetical protein